MEARLLSSPVLSTRTSAAAGRRPRGPALVLAAAFPLLFLHVEYQPTATLDVGPTDVTASLSDLAVLAVVAAAVPVARREGLGRLRPGLPLWAAAGAFLALVVTASVYPVAYAHAYDWPEHLVTALKFAQYALLAPAVALVVGDRHDLRALAVAAVVWVAAAAVVGLLQFVGLVPEFEGIRPAQREPSFLGIHDFAAAGGAAVALALAAVAFPAAAPLRRSAAVLAGVVGVLAVVLSGALAGALGVFAAVTAVGLFARTRGRLGARRAGALAAVALTTAAGVTALRTADLDAFVAFLGADREAETTEVHSYNQRVVLAYIGGLIFLDHPIVGAGWQASSEDSVYGRYVDDARERFPDEPARTFPSPEHPWGVQNAYVQALADLGVVGFLALAATLVAALLLAGRAALRSPPATASAGVVALVWVLTAASVWLGLGLVAGIPTDALLWLGAGLAAAARAGIDAGA